MTATPKIYTITMLQKIENTYINEDDNISFPTFGDRRCVGYYHVLANAINVVENNYKDIYDNLYEYCVIEEIKEGIYNYGNRLLVYQWQNDHYELIKTPTDLSKMCGFGIG